MNSRKTRRNKVGFKGAGTPQWEKTTPYGKMPEKEKFLFAGEMDNARHIGLYGKHIGSVSPVKIKANLRRWNDYQLISKK